MYQTVNVINENVKGFEDVFASLKEHNQTKSHLTIEFCQPLNWEGEFTPNIEYAVAEHDQVEKVTIHEGGTVTRQTTGATKPCNYDWIRTHIMNKLYLYGASSMPEYNQRCSTFALLVPTSAFDHEAETLQTVFRFMLRDPKYTVTDSVDGLRFERKQACSLAHARDQKLAVWFRLGNEKVPLPNDPDYVTKLCAMQQATDPMINFENPDLGRLEYRVATAMAAAFPMLEQDNVQGLLEYIVTLGKQRSLVIELNRRVPDPVTELGRRVLVPRLGGYGLAAADTAPYSTATFPIVSVHPTYERDLVRISEAGRISGLKGGLSGRPVLSFIQHKLNDE